jgi:hypothetical protein
MRLRLPLYVLLASALTFLASLYLPWRSAHPGADLTGWTNAGYVAALFAVALAAVTATTLLRPSVLLRLPFGGLGVGLAYFSAAVAVQVHAFSTFPLAVPPEAGPVAVGWTGSANLHYHWAYGAYMGIGSGIAAAVTALLLRRRELLSPRSTSEGAAAILCLALLASFLLPWIEAGAPRVSMIGLDFPAAVIAAAGIILGAGQLSRCAEVPLRLCGAVSAAVLTGAAASQTASSRAAHGYGAWLGIGSAAALVVLEAVRARSLRLPAVPRWAALRTGAALLLVVGLFLPALSYGVGRFHVAASGWQTSYGAAAGALALVLLFAPLLPRVESYGLDATLAIALLVATLGIGAAEEPGSILSLGYGAYIDFAAAAALLVLALARLRPVGAERRRLLVRAVPLATTVACLTAILVPLWSVLPELWTLQATAVHGWFSLVALLIALYLLRAWTLRITAASTPPHVLTVAPLVLLVLPALQIVLYRDEAIVWGGVILVALCLLLALLGWIEESRGGLENIGLPEILRIDRLAETES